MQQLIKKYTLYGITLYVILFFLGSDLWGDTWGISLFNIFTFASYALLLHFGNKGLLNYTEKILKITVFSYSLFCVMILNLLFFYHHGDFFQFQSYDEQLYDRVGKDMAAMPFLSSIRFFLITHSYEDLGVIMYISTLYRIIADTLFVNFMNVVCGTFSALLLYRIGKLLMSYRYAFYAAVAFFIASFWLRFESSGLKESIFVLLELSAFYHFLMFHSYKRKWSIVWSILLGASLMLFRPAVLAMLIASIGIWLMLDRYGSTLRNLVLGLAVAVVFVLMSSSLDRMTNTFSSFEKSVEIRSDATAKAGEDVAIYAAVLSSSIGPMPNLLARVGKENNSLYASGLLLRVLLAVPFWLGVWFIIKHRLSQFYPMLVMCLMGMGALLYIMESYELRYHLTHLPFLYLIAFYYLSYVDSLQGRIKQKKVRLLELGYLGCMLIVLYWNLRIL